MKDKIKKHFHSLQLYYENKNPHFKKYLLKSLILSGIDPFSSKTKEEYNKYKESLENPKNNNSKYINENEIQPNFSFKNLDKLRNYVIGQDKACDIITNKIKASEFGFKSETKPIASFLLTGPTGVGKTEMAKAIAKLCFDDKLFVLDMTTFKSEADISRIVGASPMYVGYDDKMALCEYLKKNSRCVVLFDELEKSHPGCFDIIMRMIDEGEFITAKGEKVSLSQTVIICTSNITQHMKDSGKFAHSSNAAELIAKNGAIKKEIIGRFDDIIEFEKLSKESCKLIVKNNFLDKNIKLFEKNNAKKNLKLDYSEDLVDEIISETNTDVFGARDLKKAIQQKFINKVTNYLSNNLDLTNSKITVFPDRCEVKLIPKAKTQEKQNDNSLEL